MLKTILLGTAMCIAAPAFAQEKPATDTQTQDAMPVTEPAAPAQDAPQPAEPATTPATPTTPAPATAAAQPTPAAQPASQQDQIAGIVNSEFAAYDKNGDGALDQTEFASWMVALRVKAQPEFVADSAEGKAWVTAAFTQADTDKSASVNAVELTSFLTPKPAA